MRTVANAANSANVVANVRNRGLVSIVARFLRHLTDRLGRGTEMQMRQHEPRITCQGWERMYLGKEIKLCPVPVSKSQPCRSKR